MWSIHSIGCSSIILSKKKSKMCKKYFKWKRFKYGNIWNITIKNSTQGIHKDKIQLDVVTSFLAFEAGNRIKWFTSSRILSSEMILSTMTLLFTNSLKRNKIHLPHWSVKHCILAMIFFKFGARCCWPTGLYRNPMKWAYFFQIRLYVNK